MEHEMGFSAVTACGECCTACEKKRKGVCPGCIEADGCVPEWRESGRCRIHACARAHGVQFCGLCRDFPCKELQELVPWDPEIPEKQARLAEKYRRQQKRTGRTLYVSDLDGTLLRSDQRTSAYTNRIINALVEEGMLFSYATARSHVSSHRVTAGLTARLPLILYNGASILDSGTGKLLAFNFFDRNAVRELIDALLDGGCCPIVYAYVEGREKFSYLTDRIPQATRDFIATRPNDPRDRPVRAAEELKAGEIFYLSMIDTPESLRPFYEKYRGRFRCLYQRDIYSGDQWLEILPPAATKANAVRQLADLLDCDHIVVFGDGLNDVDLFEMADEAYAVENAVPELKKAATAVIASNDSDGVAKWLYERFYGRQPPEDE